MFQALGIVCERGERRIFSDLDFQVEPGRALVLRGPNGSGKTSILRIAATLLRAADGQLTWNGTNIFDDVYQHRSRLHFIGHQDAVKGALTVRENVEVWANIRGSGAGHVDRALAAFGITHLADTPAQYLSAGQHRRTALARLVASPAMLWLLDEPTVSLDADGTTCLQNVIADHRAAQGMVIATTHIELGLLDADLLQLNPK